MIKDEVHCLIRVFLWIFGL